MAGVEALNGLIEALPDDLRGQALTHSSWTEHRSDSYGRLAFLGDSVLGLAIAEDLYDRFPRSDIGHLTKVHGQAVSGRACAALAKRLDVAELLADAAPDPTDQGIDAEALRRSERAMASVIEALIAACYFHHGYEATAPAVVAALEDEIELASENLLDFKSALQERLARAGSTVSYVVTDESGPPHDRRFEVEARVGDETLGAGSGRSKKAAEQAAANEALERLGT
jgi:ribonuclease III